MEQGESQAKLESYLQQVIRNGGFDLRYSITPLAAASSEAQPGMEPGPVPPGFAVNFSGPDVSLLSARNGELLHAIESIAAELLGLLPGEHHRLVFDAEGFRAERARSLEQAVEQACEGVKRSGRPHAFPPMNSRERRLVHLAAAAHGITTASSGEGPRRSVVLYPAGQMPAADESAPARSFSRGEGSMSPSLPGERRSHIPHVPDNIGNRAGSRADDRGNRFGFGGDRNRRSGGGSRSGGYGARGSSGSRQPSERPFSEQTFTDLSISERQPFDPQAAIDGDDTPREDQPSAEDRARAIRERFRKR